MNSEQCITKLKELGVYGKFVKNLKEGYQACSIRKYCKIYDEGNGEDFGDEFLGGAFIWHDTPEGHGFWDKIAHS